MSDPLVEEALWKRISLEIARFKPFDGESYDGFARRLIRDIRAESSDTIEALQRRVEELQETLRLIADLAARGRAKDDWFEFVEIEHLARSLLQGMDK